MQTNENVNKYQGNIEMYQGKNKMYQGNIEMYQRNIETSCLLKSNDDYSEAPKSVAIGRMISVSLSRH